MTGKRTPLYSEHDSQAAQFAEHSGLCLPLHYGSATAEHQAVRDSAGMFDVSQVGIVDLCGDEVQTMLRSVMTNDVGKLDDGQGMYSCMCHEYGGVIDHLVVFRMTSSHFRLYIDVERRQKDLSWLDAHRGADVVIEELDGLSHIAVQGPDAVSLVTQSIASMGLPLDLQSLPRYGCLQSGRWFISRTGYSGEDGVEILLPDEQVSELWQTLNEHGVLAAGLVARESLRIEAGFAHYGNELDEEHTPAESGVTIAVDVGDESRQFIGRETIEDHMLFGGRMRLIGLVHDGQGQLRSGQSVELVGKPVGKITSATHSPVRASSVALARVEKSFTGACDINTDTSLLAAQISSVPFVPHGQARE
ncbi:MAG: glycine cleavage system aminomethyltransferase GcvT [Granulosicoccus sp.]|nr:glycine cleavage system aminomethyltransferase GcvT [Granulosicoccus sp.]